jgi:hypothetical protein
VISPSPARALVLVSGDVQHWGSCPVVDRHASNSNISVHQNGRLIKPRGTGARVRQAGPTESVSTLALVGDPDECNGRTLIFHPGLK